MEDSIERNEKLGMGNQELTPAAPNPSTPRALGRLRSGQISDWALLASLSSCPFGFPFFLDPAQSPIFDAGNPKRPAGRLDRPRRRRSERTNAKGVSPRCLDKKQIHETPRGGQTSDSEIFAVEDEVDPVVRSFPNTDDQQEPTDLRVTGSELLREHLGDPFGGR